MPPGLLSQRQGKQAELHKGSGTHTRSWPGAGGARKEPGLVGPRRLMQHSEADRTTCAAAIKNDGADEYLMDQKDCYELLSGI